MIFSLGNKKPVPQEKFGTLYHINLPALAGRSDAAYNQAISIFSKNAFSKNQAERQNVYQKTLKLLDIALDARRSLFFLSLHYENKKDPLSQYLLLLKDTIQAAYALITHEIIILQDEKQLSSFIGRGITDQLKSADEIFTNSELSICQSIFELIQKATPAINRYKERILKVFNHEELVRYKKSFNEFISIYNHTETKEASRS